MQNVGYDAAELMPQIPGPSSLILIRMNPLSPQSSPQEFFTTQ